MTKIKFKQEPVNSESIEIYVKPSKLYGENKSKIYRDKIWGDITLSKLAVAIIDTPEFQRLDRVKQLGFSDYVFRCAKHTRFLHSIGTYHVAKKTMQSVWENHARFKNLDLPMDKLKWDELIDIVATAALLHDISHFPQGHPLEDELQGLYLKHDALSNTRLYHLLYDKRSRLARVFSTEKEKYFNLLSNSDLRDLIFLIIKYRKEINFPEDPSVEEEDIKEFNDLIQDELNDL